MTGWLFNVKWLVTFYPSWPSLKFNTAISILFASGSLLSFIGKKKLPGNLLAIFVLLIGFVTLAEYLFHWDAHVDEWLIKDNWTPANQFPGRMASFTTIALILTGISLLTYTSGKRWVHYLSEVCAILLFTLAFTGFVGALYNAGQLFRMAHLASFSVPSAITGLAISIAILFSKPETGIVSVFYRKTTIATAGFKGIFIVIALLILIGWLCIKGYENDVFEREMGIVVMIAVFTLSFLFIVISGINRLNETEERLKSSEKNLRQVLTSYEDTFYVVDKNYRILLLNEAAKINLTKGWGKAVNTGDHVLEIIPNHLKEQVKQSFEKVFNGIRVEYELKVPIEGLPDWVLVTYTPVRDEHGAILGAYVITKDISLRKKAEQELKNSYSRFELISRTTNDAIWEWDLETGQLWGNETHQQLYGLTANEPVPTEEMWLNRIHPDDRERMKNRQAESLISGKNVFISEYRFMVEGKGYRNIYDRCYIVRNKEGKPVRMVGSMMDITERIEMEEALRKSEQQYRSLIEQASDYIMITDENINLIDVNSSLCNTFGYTREELIGKSGVVLIDPEQLQKDPIKFDLLREGQSIVRERSLKCKDGTLIDVEINAKRLPDGRILAIARNITDRKQAQEALTQSENYLRAIVQAEPECVKILGENMELKDMNPAGLAMIEADSLEQVKGKSVLGIIKKEYQQRFIRLTQNVLKGNKGTLEFEIIGLKGTHRWLETHAVPLKDPEGKIVSLLGVTRDITERKKAEEQLQASYKQIRQLTEYIQNIAEEERAHIAREIHDELGQQLTVLKMDASWLNKKLATADENIRQKLTDLLELLDGTVRTVRKISSQLRPSLLDDMGLVAAMEWHLKEFERRTAVKTKFIFSGQEFLLPDTIKTALFRIFQESLTNVARHSDAKNVEVNLQQQNGKIILSIKDDGKGFEKDNALNKKTLGILGMQERSFMMGGIYEVNSKPGEGTLVVVSVPFSNN